MKKIYEIPEVNVESMMFEHHICDVSPGAGFDPSIGDGSDEAAKWEWDEHDVWNDSEEW